MAKTQHAILLVTLLPARNRGREGPKLLFDLAVGQPSSSRRMMRIRCATLAGRLRFRRKLCSSPRSVGVRCKTSIFAINTWRIDTLPVTQGQPTRTDLSTHHKAQSEHTENWLSIS